VCLFLFEVQYFTIFDNRNTVEVTGKNGCYLRIEEMEKENQINPHMTFYHEKWRDSLMS